MRKWVRIVVAVLLVLVVFALPWNETQLHKMRCEAAWNRFRGKSIGQRFQALYYRLTRGTPLPRKWSSDDWRELKESREALVDVGYLARQRFILRNGPTQPDKAFYKEYPETAFACVEFYWNNTLVVIAPPSEMAAISNLVRRIDERAQ